MTAALKLGDVSIQCRNFKCFGDDWQGIHRVKPVNIIIGRNSSGKSSLLDLLYSFCDGISDVKSLGHLGKQPEVRFEFQVTEELANTFMNDVSVRVRIDNNELTFTPKEKIKRLLSRNGTATLFTYVVPENSNNDKTEILVKTSVTVHTPGSSDGGF